MEEIRDLNGTTALRWPDTCAVLYGASWCPASLRLRKALTQYPNLPLVWADIETYPEAAAQDNIQGIPTIVLRKNGNPVDRRIGMQDTNEIRDWLANHGLVDPPSNKRGLLEWSGLSALVSLLDTAGTRKI